MLRSTTRPGLRILEPLDPVDPEAAIAVVGHVDSAEQHLARTDLQLARDQPAPALIAGLVHIIELQRALQRIDVPIALDPLLIGRVPGRLQQGCRKGA